MKLYLIAALALIVGVDAQAYTSPSSVDFAVGGVEVEARAAVKSSTDLYSDAITKGHGLYYSENELTGAYKVSRYSAEVANSAAAAKLIACIAGRDVATGDTASFPCVTRGYVDYAKYDATAAIAKGGYLCIGTAASVKGVLLACDTNVVSPIMALEAKASGAGSDLKVLVQSR